MAHINLPPDLDKHKSKMENELLIKLGVKKEEVRLCCIKIVNIRNCFLLPCKTKHYKQNNRFLSFVYKCVAVEDPIIKKGWLRSYLPV